MSFVYALEMLGTAAFAVSGALAASRKRMDIFGFCVLALMPAVGGGTVRDVIIDRVPVFWISDNRYVAVAIIAALVVFEVEPYAASVMIAAAALPVAGNVFILAQRVIVSQLVL